MPATILVYPLYGATVDIPPGNEEFIVTTPTPAANYFFFAQTSGPITCWQRSVETDAFVVGFQGPVDPGTTLNYLLVNKSSTGVAQLVISAGQTSRTIAVDPTRFSIFVMPTWNTTVWLEPAGFDQTTVNFSGAPGVDSFIYYYIVPIGRPGAFTEPILSGAKTAAIELLSGTSFIPFVTPYWNTAIGVTPNPEIETLFLQFSNPGPFPDSQVTFFTQFVEIAPPAAIVPTVPDQQPFEIVPLDTDTLEKRLADLYPNHWLNSAAKEPGGVAFALFSAYASQLAFIMLQLHYAWMAGRLGTSQGEQLDLFSQDYFGTILPRLPGENDDHFRTRIQALLFQPKVTRAAIANAIVFFTGGTVRMIEPWNPSDTGYYGITGANPPTVGSFYDYDTEQVPSLWGDPGLRYQGFIQIELPPAQGNNCPIWGYDAGAGYDLITGIEWETSNQFALQEQVVNQLISYLIAFGTTAWVKYVSGFENPFTFGASIGIATGLFEVKINTPNLAGLYGFFAQLSLPIAVWIQSIQFDSFTPDFQVPVSSGTFLNYLGVESGSSVLSATDATPGSISRDVTGDFVANNLFAMPTWDTTIYYSNRSNTGITLNFSNPPGVDSAINLLTVPVNPNIGIQEIQADATEWTIVLTLADHRHVPFGMVNWNSAVGVMPNFADGTVTFIFSNPAPSDGSGELLFTNVDIRDLD
jgi:hypothetical protein